MLLTKENDYAIRMVRAIKDGKKHTMKEICLVEDIPEAFAYKIVRKLQKTEIIKVERGATGGCKLGRLLSELTLYDVIAAVDGEPLVTQCLRNPCIHNEGDFQCKVHQELMKVQQVLMNQLKEKTLEDIF